MNKTIHKTVDRGVYLQLLLGYMEFVFSKNSMRSEKFREACEVKGDKCHLPDY